MKKVIFLVVVVCIVSLYVLSPFLQGWAYQNAFDRQQYRSESAADWQLSYEERQLKLAERESISGAVVAGKTFGLGMFWMLVGFVCIMVMAFIGAAFYNFLKPKPAYTQIYKPSIRYIQAPTRYAQLREEEPQEIIQYNYDEMEYTEM